MSKPYHFKSYFYINVSHEAQAVVLATRGNFAENLAGNIPDKFILWSFRARNSVSSPFSPPLKSNAYEIENITRIVYKVYVILFSSFSFPDLCFLGDVLSASSISFKSISIYSSPFGMLQTESH